MERWGQTEPGKYDSGFGRLEPKPRPEASEMLSEDDGRDDYAVVKESIAPEASEGPAAFEVPMDDIDTAEQPVAATESQPPPGSESVERRAGKPLLPDEQRRVDTIMEALQAGDLVSLFQAGADTLVEPDVSLPWYENITTTKRGKKRIREKTVLKVAKAKTEEFLSGVAQDIMSYLDADDEEGRRLAGIFADELRHTQPDEAEELGLLSRIQKWWDKDASTRDYVLGGSRLWGSRKSLFGLFGQKKLQAARERVIAATRQAAGAEQDPERQELLRRIAEAWEDLYQREEAKAR